MTTGILAADEWTPASPYPVAACWRGQHDHAVVLDGTTILVAGGADAAGASLRHSAVLDLTSGEWSDPAPLLGTARQLHAMTLLPDGRVLATGGRGPGGVPLNTAEIYDPENGWAAVTATMATARFGHSATVLSDGLVLVAGGSGQRTGGGVVALRSAELFNPGDGSWEPVGKDMADARTGHTAVALDSGAKVLVCGGSVPVGTATDADLAFCELYDTVAGTWQPTRSMKHARSGHSATALTATTVLVAGGRAPGASDVGFDPFARATAEVFSLGGEQWADVDDMPGGRAFHRAVPFGSGKALVLGGADQQDNETGYRGALLFENGAWSQFAGLGEGRWAFAAGAAGTKVLVVGGVTRTGLAAATGAVELTATAERSGT